MLKFADDTKVICPIENEDYGETLQADLARLMDGLNITDKRSRHVNKDNCISG